MIKLNKWSAGRDRYSRSFEAFFVGESRLEHYLLADFTTVMTVGNNFALSPASRRRLRYSRFDDFVNHLRSGGRIEKHPFYR